MENLAEIERSEGEENEALFYCLEYKPYVRREGETRKTLTREKQGGMLGVW